MHELQSQDRQSEQRMLDSVTPGHPCARTHWSLRCVYPDRDGRWRSKAVGVVDLSPLQASAPAGRTGEGEAGDVSHLPIPQPGPSSTLIQELSLEGGDYLSMAALPAAPTGPHGHEGGGQHEGQRGRAQRYTGPAPSSRIEQRSTRSRSRERTEGTASRGGGVRGHRGRGDRQAGGQYRRSTSRSDDRIR